MRGGEEMEDMDGINRLLCERIEEILKKKTALTSEDINAVKELSMIIVNFAQIRLIENQYALVGRSGRFSQRLSKEN